MPRVAKKAPEKKLGKRAIATLNKGFYGDEPVYTGLLTAKELGDALTWYNYNMDDKTSIEQLILYLESIDRPEEIKAVKSAGLRWAPLGHMARIINMGGTLPEASMDRLEAALSEAVTRYQADKNSTPKVVYKDTPRLNEKNVGILEPIQEAVDRLAPRFNVGKYLTKAAVSKTIGIKIAAYYGDELETAKKRPQSKENDAYIAYLDKVISEAYAYSGTERPKEVVKVAKVRKPRRKKIIPPEKKVAKVKIAVDYPDFGLKSVAAKDIIGAKALWVYDTRYSKLTVLRAKDGGLDVKGSTVLNFDETSSESKRIGRKAQATTKLVVETGKVGLRHIFSGIKSGNIKFTGRLSANNVLLRIEK